MSRTNPYSEFTKGYTASTPSGAVKVTKGPHLISWQSGGFQAFSRPTFWVHTSRLNPTVGAFQNPSRYVPETFENLEASARKMGLPKKRGRENSTGGGSPKAKSKASKPALLQDAGAQSQVANDPSKSGLDVIVDKGLEGFAVDDPSPKPRPVAAVQPSRGFKLNGLSVNNFGQPSSAAGAASKGTPFSVMLNGTQVSNPQVAAKVGTMAQPVTKVTTDAAKLGELAAQKVAGVAAKAVETTAKVATKVTVTTAKAAVKITTHTAKATGLVVGKVLGL